MTEIERLVSGKSDLQRIVSIEINDEYAEIFTQGMDGSITSSFVPNRFWVLANKNIDGSFSKLTGSLHYSHGRQFKLRDDFIKMRNIWKKHEVYSIWNPVEAFNTLKGTTYYKGMQPKEVSVLSFDLETTSLNPAQEGAQIILISNTFRNSNGAITKKLFSYDEFESEEEMLIAWGDFVYEMDPSIITGYNIFGFDLKYILERCKILNISLKVGRNGSDFEMNKHYSSFRIDGSRDMDFKDIKCYGREIIDGMFLALRYDAVKKKYDNYKLKQVIKQEGLEKPGRTFYDADKIRFNFRNHEELQKIKAYCVDDSDDGLAVFDLMCPAYFYQTQYCTRSFQGLHQSATGALINGILVRSYLQENHSIPKADELEKLEGGISFAIPGVYRNVIKVDLKSAYPSQVLRFKLYDAKKDPKGNFYNLVKYFTEQRFHYKKMFKETGDSKWENLDAAGKIFINSAYGSCSTNGLNFNSVSTAAKITLETRKVIDLALKWASGAGVDYWMPLFKEITQGDTEDEAV